uniref:Protein kinase domain-containing protein n=1 Tax=Maylandia zebra TaxID=106582 RepID=A0A3P9BVU5_9CICH
MSLDIRFSSLKMYFAFLGEGGFGIVAKCRDTMTNRAVAIKVNKKGDGGGGGGGGGVASSAPW